MSFLEFANDPVIRLSRRKFIGNGVLLSGAAVALLSGNEAREFGMRWRKRTNRHLGPCRRRAVARNVR